MEIPKTRLYIRQEYNHQLQVTYESKYLSKPLIPEWYYPREHKYPIRELVDSLCRDGTEAQYIQYLSKSRITSPKIH